MSERVGWSLGGSCHGRQKGRLEEIGLSGSCGGELEATLYVHLQTRRWLKQQTTWSIQEQENLAATSYAHMIRSRILEQYSVSARLASFCCAKEQGRQSGPRCGGKLVTHESLEFGADGWMKRDG